MSASTTPPPRRSPRAAASRCPLIGGGTSPPPRDRRTIAVWPASEADKARTDGEQFGQAVAQLHDAQSRRGRRRAGRGPAAATDTRDHAGDAVAEQVADQADALDRAADGFVGTHTADDAFEQDLYQAELDVAVDDLADQAEDFRTTGPGGPAGVLGRLRDRPQRRLSPPRPRPREENADVDHQPPTPAAGRR